MPEIEIFDALERFLGYFQAIKARSPLTVKEYRYDLVLFFRYLLRRRGLVAPSLPFEQIQLKQIDDSLLRSVQLTDFYAYITWLSQERHCAPATRARKIAALRAFFAYLKKQVLHHRCQYPPPSLNRLSCSSACPGTFPSRKASICWRPLLLATMN